MRGLIGAPARDATSYSVGATSAMIPSQKIGLRRKRFQTSVAKASRSGFCRTGVARLPVVVGAGAASPSSTGVTGMACGDELRFIIPAIMTQQKLRASL